MNVSNKESQARYGAKRFYTDSQHTILYLEQLFMC